MENNSIAISAELHFKNGKQFYRNHYYSFGTHHYYSFGTRKKIKWPLVHFIIHFHTFIYLARYAIHILHTHWGGGRSVGIKILNVPNGLCLTRDYVGQGLKSHFLVGHLWWMTSCIFTDGLARYRLMDDLLYFHRWTC